jgi:hypothetical protein
VEAVIREHKMAMEREEEADVPREDILTTLLRLQSNDDATLTSERVSRILFVSQPYLQYLLLPPIKNNCR